MQIIINLNDDNAERVINGFAEYKGLVSDDIQIKADLIGSEIESYLKESIETYEAKKLEKELNQARNEAVEAKRIEIKALPIIDSLSVELPVALKAVTLIEPIP